MKAISLTSSKNDMLYEQGEISDALYKAECLICCLNSPGLSVDYKKDEKGELLSPLEI